MSVDQAQELYRRLIAPIEDKMVSIISRTVPMPDDADDVLQQALVVVWEKLPNLARHPNPHAYILRICLSCSVDHLRRQNHRREVRLPVDCPEPADCPPDPVAASETAQTVRDAIGHLPPHQARAVVLRALEDFSYADIGGILGCSDQTARSHFAKGMARLRSVLASLGWSQS